LNFHIFFQFDEGKLPPCPLCLALSVGQIGVPDKVGRPLSIRFPCLCALFIRFVANGVVYPIKINNLHDAVRKQQESVVQESETASDHLADFDRFPFFTKKIVQR
jgi:hypothetical protein